MSKWHLFFKSFLLIGLFLGIGSFCLRQTKGFQIYQIRSSVGNDPKWETSSENLKEVNRLLHQTFTFFNSGEQCYAFLGEDQKTVLKLFKHYVYLKPRPLDFVFQSCRIAEQQLKEETGLLYLHLNKNQKRHPDVILVDPLGIAHRFPLDTTEFIVQKRGTLLFKNIKTQMQRGDIEAAKRSISSLFSHLMRRCQKGIGETDSSLRRNFAYVEDVPVHIDIGSFFKEDSLRQPSRMHQELIQKTERLHRWLKKHYPELAAYYEEELTKLNKVEI